MTVQDLRQLAETWDRLMVGSLILGALAATAIVVTTQRSIKWNGAVREKDAEAFEKYKVDAGERTATLEKAAQDARLETELIKARVAWRTLPPDQLQSLTSILAATNGSVTLAYVQNDPEAIYLTTVLSNVFNAANRFEPASKWHVEAQPRMYSDRNIFGVHIFGKNPDVVAAIRHAFEFAKVEYLTDDVPEAVTVLGGVTTSSGTPNTDAVIMVGSKLPAF